jgi:predicted RNase H-like HicB family nuclease
MARELVVFANWDDEAKVWVAHSEDVPGLATEAADWDLLMKKLKVMIPELLDANGYADDDEEIPFKVVGEARQVAHREAA